MTLGVKPAYLSTLPVILYDMGEEKRVTFRADPDQIETLDKAIMRAKVDDRLDDDVSRSDLLRLCVDQMIDELEDSEGNRTAAMLVDSVCLSG